MAELAPELERARNVLVIKPSSLGDIVHALPTVALIKAARPDASISAETSTDLGTWTGNGITPTAEGFSVPRDVARRYLRLIFELNP